MNSTLRNALLLIIVIVSGFFVWYFFRIFLYILISAVLSLLGQPLVDFLHSVHIRSYRIPQSISAFATLMVMIAAFFAFILFFFPLLASQASFLTDLDLEAISGSIQQPIANLESFLRNWKILQSDETIAQRIASEFSSIATFDRFSELFNSVLSITIELFFGFLAISFITFFFLKEKKLFSSIVIFFTPIPHRKEATEILSESKYLLRRYIVGLITDLSAIFILITLCMWLLGLPNALIIGFFAGILNIIPYLGPVIATFIGVFMGISVNLDMDFYSQLLPLIISIVAVFIIVNTIDVGVLQPAIYSKSVKSHPLEIFIVFMVAGMVGGIFGMIIAIPAYSVVRIFIRQFIVKSKIVEKFRQSLNNPEAHQ